jgi:hypothetical protein
MRVVMALALHALLLLPGCLEDGEDPAPMDEPMVVATTNATAPEPLHHEGEFIAASDPANAVMPICFGPSVDAPCHYYEFSTNVTADLEATLAWGLEANDLDLYLYEGDTELSREGINAIGDPPNTSQVLVHPGLPPGDYTLWVVAWNAAQESYTLDVLFS